MTNLPTLGAAFRQLRRQLGLCLPESANEIGVSEWLLEAFEDGALAEYQTAELNDQIFSAWGFDLHQFMAAYYFTGENCPESLRASAKALAEGCRRHIEAIIEARKTS